MESKIRYEYSLYVTWTSKVLLDCLNVQKSMSFLQTFKKMKMLVITKVKYQCKILHCSKPCAVAINIVLLQVKLFNLIFPIFETSFRSHQNSVV